MMVEVDDLDRPEDPWLVPVAADGSFELSELWCDDNYDALSLVVKLGTMRGEPLLRCVAVGDCNNSRRGPPDWEAGVTIADVILVRYAYLYALSPAEYPERDVNASGSLTLADVVLTRAIYLRLLL